MSSASPAPPPSPEQSARELDALVLVRLFGWRWAKPAWHKGQPLYALIPPPENEWEPAPDGDGQWERMPADFTPADTERFRKWDQSCVRHARRNSPESWKAPSPSTDPGAAMLAAHAAIDRLGGGSTMIFELIGAFPGSGDSPAWECVFRPLWGEPFATADANTPERAICLAILAALAALAAAPPEGTVRP
jgi:hypothetical protein